MKKIYLYNILCAALLCSSCSSDWLDVYPTTSVGTDEIKTLEDLQYAMNGVYRLASAHSYYGDNYLYYGDCRAEDVQARITKGTNGRVSPYYEYNAIATDNFNIVLPWNQVYKVIRQTNNIIDKVDRGTIENADAQMLDSIKAVYTEPLNYADGGYMKKMPKDAWGRDFIYICPGDHSDFDIISYGADGQEDGEGAAADINNWE